MLTAIEIENFKGIGGRRYSTEALAPGAPRPGVRVDFAPMTLLFGANSAGKSTILHALHYAYEVLSRGNLDATKTMHGGDSLDLGGFRSLVHCRDLKRSVRIRLEYAILAAELPALYGTPSGDDEDPIPGRISFDNYNEGLVSAMNRAGNPFLALELFISWSETVSRPIVESYSVALLDGTVLGRIETSVDGLRSELCDVDLAHPLIMYNSGSDSGGISIEMDPHGNLRSDDVRREALSDQAVVHAWRDEKRIGCRGVGTDGLPIWNQLLGLELSAEREFLYPAYTAAELDLRLSALLVSLGQYGRDALESFRYVGPLRQVTARDYIPGSMVDVGRWADGVAAWDLLSESADYWRKAAEDPSITVDAQGVTGKFVDGVSGKLVEEVSRWLSEPDLLATGYSLRGSAVRELTDDQPYLSTLLSSVAPEDIDLDRVAAELRALPAKSRLELFDDQLQLAVNPSEVGTGISQLLPVIVAALDPGRPQLTAIEQPELHVHPRVQVELGDLFAHSVCHGTPFPPLTPDAFDDIADAIEKFAAHFSEARYLLIETHSEHLLLRLLRRIEETSSGDLPPGKPKLSKEDVSVVFFEEQDGEVRATVIRIDDTGEFIERWPRGFFEERADELI